ncbi:hypothetical protein LOTGIDRAFT_237157 [Lottia gigantea]|uniref:Lens fiber membrane intrinsic protein n=1 Tax=Lottia gigantea TaxID=225164 RepID=V3ZID2_LOTGI|nr:hypothetical protein LOTGIDRAFT_237157 [Lottia gigantea]ESO82075.1 hypothetical protein LOTGIDRAFT_237157 [Lottia gigantea]
MVEIKGFSLFSLLAVILAGIGCLFHLIGLSVVYWVVSDPFVSGYGSGLWQQCGLTCASYSYTPDYWKATQAFVIIGLLIGVGGLVMSLVAMIQKTRMFRLLGMVGCAAAALCILLAIIIFGASITLGRGTQWGWGFILCIISSFFFIAAAVLNFLEYRGAAV